MFSRIANIVRNPVIKRVFVVSHALVRPLTVSSIKWCEKQEAPAADGPKKPTKVRGTSKLHNALFGPALILLFLARSWPFESRTRRDEHKVPGQQCLQRIVWRKCRLVVIPTKSQGHVPAEENPEDMHSRWLHLHGQSLSHLQRRVPSFGLSQRKVVATIHFAWVRRGVELQKDGSLSEEAFGTPGGCSKGARSRILNLWCAF